MATAQGPQFPPLPPLNPGADGYSVPPPGRWSCSRTQFEAEFVCGDPFRASLVADLDSYWGQQTRHGLVVLSYWIGGSFVSDKAQPRDIDFTAIIDGASSNPDLSASDWTNPGPGWKYQVHPEVGRTLNVDAYALAKFPDGHPLTSVYHQQRGQWDDWWQRSRATGEALTRGYVEVVSWL
jgi:hypothetical protein